MLPESGPVYDLTAIDIKSEQQHIHAWYEWWTIGPELSVKTL
jgi:hypothetical protein